MAEELRKILLADSLSKYIKEKKTQEECIGFIDGFNKCYELINERE